jgi:hypothetical protein
MEDGPVKTLIIVLIVVGICVGAPLTGWGNGGHGIFHGTAFVVGIILDVLAGCAFVVTGAGL